MIIGHSSNAWCTKLRARMMPSEKHLWWCAQFGKAVSLTEGMVKSGTRPDQFTFTAIVAACQRANEAEVAFEVFRYDLLCCAVLCCAVLYSALARFCSAGQSCDAACDKPLCVSTECATTLLSNTQIPLSTAQHVHYVA